MDADRCICCGSIVPEGRHVCPECERGGKVAMQILVRDEIVAESPIMAQLFARCKAAAREAGTDERIAQSWCCEAYRAGREAGIHAAKERPVR